MLMEDVERLEQFLAHQIPDITVAVVVPLTVFVYLLTVNIPMALILVVPIILTLVLQSIMMVLVTPKMQDFSVVQGQLNSALLQFVNGMPVMKAYNLTANSYQAYSKAGEDFNILWKQISRMAAPISAVCKVLIESGVSFTLPMGGFLYLAGYLDLSSYVFFVIMSIVFLSSYNNLMNFAQIFSQISAGLGRIKDIMDIPEMPTGQEHFIVEKNCPCITFSHVKFAYQKKEVLHDINLELPAGSLTAFVGVSGAGKSTAAQLIPRFWDVTSGQIQIGEHNIKDLCMDNLMDTVTLRYFPAIVEEWSHIREAMRLRPIASRQKSIPKKIAVNVECYLVPLFIAASKTADELAAAALTRGIENPTQRTCRGYHQISRIDIFLIILCGLIIFTAGIAKVVSLC